MPKQTVAIVGLGYVGLPLALLTAEKDYEVIGIDLDTKKNELINQGRSPITDDFVDKRLGKVKLQATDKADELRTADIIIVCVPTPVHHDYQPDLGPLKGACTTVAQNLAKGTLLIIESTINPGVSEEVLLPLLEEASGLKAGEDFDLSHCPERINPGDEKWNVQNIPRVVGSYTQEGLDRTVAFYESILDAAVKPMGSLKEAEAVKVVENSFRDVNIAFVNELAMSFSTLGINVVNVINGAATKPFAFMPHYPGMGVGGHCIPVDPYYLIEYAKQSGFNHEFLMLARNINNGMPEFAIEQLIDGLNEVGIALSRARVAVLGLSYKPNVGDDRESPSYVLIDKLKDKGAEVTTFDPYFTEQSSAKSLEAACEGAEAVVIATAHKDFLDMDIDRLKGAGIKVVIDGRNCLDKSRITDNGITYRGIGV
ncbi:MAG: nucleotide sugar dehydrogenase [Candidatus Saccharimonadales bacterium]